VEDGGRTIATINGTRPVDCTIVRVIGLHAGPVYRYTDPVTRRPNYTGGHASRAARIEPITPPGQVYASEFQDDEAARQELIQSGGAPRSEPRLVQFTSGRRRQFWVKNVVALGHAAGMLEPLAIADMQLLGHALLSLLDHFPDKQFDPALIASYNAASGEELERIRDFTILHYCASRRDTSPFWQQRAAAVPDSVAERLALYRATGASCSSGPSSSPTSTGSGSSRAAG
jgi:tryptophan halogenase